MKQKSLTHSTKSGLRKFLTTLGLCMFVGFLGCSSVQTKPTCREYHIGVIDFYNETTDLHKLAIVCLVEHAGTLSCGDAFWLSKRHVWFQVKPGKYHIEVASQQLDKTKAYEFSVKPCEVITVRFNETRNN